MKVTLMVSKIWCRAARLHFFFEDGCSKKCQNFLVEQQPILLRVLNYISMTIPKKRHAAVVLSGYLIRNRRSTGQSANRKGRRQPVAALLEIFLT